MLCLNLCGLLANRSMQTGEFASIIQRTSDSWNHEVKRIYIGSSFCQQYFMHVKYWKEIADTCSYSSTPITLTIPVFAENTLIEGKKLIRSILDTYSYAIDEVTVNDIGMLEFIASFSRKRINMGRLFAKEPRDVRYSDFYNEMYRPAILDDGELLKTVSGIEIDCGFSRFISRETDSNKCIGIHVPFCFVSTGNICKFASIPKEISQKFRPNDSCNMECQRIAEVYDEKNANALFYRIGRTIYFFNQDTLENYSEAADRIIYFPVREVIDIRGK